MRDPVERLIELISLEVALEMAEEEARPAGFERIARQCTRGRRAVLRAKEAARVAIAAEQASASRLRPGATVYWMEAGGAEHTGTVGTAYRGHRARVELPGGGQCYVAQAELFELDPEGEEVELEAERCPGCGGPLPERRKTCSGRCRVKVSRQRKARGGFDMLIAEEVVAARAKRAGHQSLDLEGEVAR